ENWRVDAVALRSPQPLSDLHDISQSCAELEADSGERIPDCRWGSGPFDSLDYSLLFQLSQAIGEHLRRHSLDVTLQFREAALALAEIPDHVWFPSTCEEIYALPEGTVGGRRRDFTFASLNDQATRPGYLPNGKPILHATSRNAES